MQDIIRWIQTIKKKFGVEALYFPDNDVYSIQLKGRAVQNFTSKVFYQLPRRHRENMIRSIIKIGLAHNVGEKNMKDKLFHNRSIGKKI